MTLQDTLTDIDFGIRTIGQSQYVYNSIGKPLRHHKNFIDKDKYWEQKYKHI